MSVSDHPSRKANNGVRAVLSGVDLATSEQILTEFLSFKSEPDLIKKENLTRALCNHFSAKKFNDQENRVVNEILNLLAVDVEISIRRTLSETLRDCDILPREVALKLAADISEISSPILQYSPVLTDEDLAAIIEATADVTKLLSISRRERISEEISGMLVRSRHKDVAKSLIRNQGAALSEESANFIIDYFKGQEDLLSLLIRRTDFPMKLAEKLVAVVSVSLKNELVDRYGIKESTASSIIEKTYENSTLNIVRSASIRQTRDLVDHLYLSGKLNHSIVLRALCKADMEFFACGVAKLAGIKEDNVYKILLHGDDNAFDALYRAARIPESMIKAAVALLKILQRQKQRPDETQMQYCKRIVEFIVDDGLDRRIPNMSYFLALVRNSSSGESLGQYA